MKFAIRKGRKQDASAILGLIKHLAEFEKEPEAVEVTIEDIEEDGFGENPLFQVLVAELNDEIVGMALYYYRYSTWKGKTIHLEDLIVLEHMRKKNIGKALYDTVLKQGFEEKVRRVEWVVLDWNTPARNFYLNSGAKILQGWETVQMDEKGLKSYVLNKNL
ncbi:GNAT family N-acetyltransferase [Urechidicola croceus]|uniref:GNAT family N-acetyltransferase n=1 Tax=Urechidicola croceus TaxID=1850246 RepID=A0A1D8P8V5_9FLAO|nr:GNAT family N-acetyltransferase [Urechidicola croceus]AOW20974.1 GNAT family N-acetyltransferase [Urechidicola croceus]